MIKYLVSLFSIFIISGCANPLNQVTSDNYAKTCSDAEEAGRWDIAEEACYRAAVNVEWGNLGDELKSERLYNLARIKRRVGKLDEAEKYFIETLEIEESLSPKREDRIGRRLAELSAIYYEQKKYEQAYPYLEKLLPLSNLYSGREKEFLANLYHYYAIELEGTEIAEKLQLTSMQLGFRETGE